MTNLPRPQAYLPVSPREMEEAGSYEGDAGHTTASRPGEPLFRRAEAAGTDRQTAQESAIREVRVAAL